MSSEERDRWPVYWLSDEPATATLWSSLRADHPSSGLWPVLIGPDYRDTSLQPWSTGEMYPSRVSRSDRHDPAGLLAEWWRQYTATSDDDMLSPAERLAVTAPFEHRWPGLTPAKQPQMDPDVVADRVASELVAANPGMRLALIAADREADAVAACGWFGPVNYVGDIAEVSAVLRSWEGRFGARVVGFSGYATLYLSVAAPPTTEAEALHVAAEHFALCPDNIWQGQHPHTLAGYAERLIGSHTWAFWWD